MPLPRFPTLRRSTSEVAGATRRSGRSGGYGRPAGRSSGAGFGRSAGRRGDSGAEQPPGHPEDDQGDPETVARTICLRLLEISPRTRRELADKLHSRGVSNDVATAVLDRFTEVGLIDDQAYASAWVDSRRRTRGLAARALSGELQRKGIEREIADEALSSVSPADEEAAARALIARKLRSTAGLDPAARTRRLLGVLARKGYSGELSRRIVREEIEAAAADGAVAELLLESD
jgi:regulatory protein